MYFLCWRLFSYTVIVPFVGNRGIYGLSCNLWVIVAFLLTDWVPCAIIFTDHYLIKLLSIDIRCVPVRAQVIFWNWIKEIVTLAFNWHLVKLPFQISAGKLVKIITFFSWTVIVGVSFLHFCQQYIACIQKKMMTICGRNDGTMGIFTPILPLI